MAIGIGGARNEPLDGAHVSRAIREDPEAAEFFLAFALTTVVRLREKLISQLFDSSEKRLARALLGLARTGKLQDQSGQDEKIIRNIDQEVLAQMIGTTRSRVNHFMNKFRRLGFIDYDAGVIVVRGDLMHLILAANADGSV